MPREFVRTVGDIRQFLTDLPDDMLVFVPSIGGGVCTSVSLEVHEVAQQIPDIDEPQIVRALIIRGQL